MSSTQHEFARVQDLDLPVAGAVFVMSVAALPVAVARARAAGAARATRDHTWLEVTAAVVIAGIVAVLLVGFEVVDSPTEARRRG